MALEIPRGWTPGRTAAIVNAAAAATPGPAQAYAPYQQLSRGIERGGSALAEFAKAAVADQELQDKIVGQQTAAGLEAAGKAIAVDIFENHLNIKGDDGKDHDASDLLDPAHPEQGTFGEKTYREKMKPIEEAAYKTLPKRQRAIAQYLATAKINERGGLLQNALIDRRGTIRAQGGLVSVRTSMAAGDFDGARRTNKSQLADGIYGQETYDALDKEISKDNLFHKVNTFSLEANSGTAVTRTVDDINAIEDPNITEEMKATARSDVLRLHDQAITQQAQLEATARNENSIVVTRGILNGQITSDAQLADYNLDDAALRAASSLIHREGSAKDDPGVMTKFSLDLSAAHKRTPREQADDVVTIGKSIDTAVEHGLISGATGIAMHERLTKLNDPVFNDPYYTEAVRRAAGFLGADVANMAPGASTDDIMMAVFHNQPKVSAALSEFRTKLDVVALDTPEGNRASLLRWAIENIEPYMKTSAGEDVANAATVRLLLPDKIDDNGNLRSGLTRKSVEDSIIDDESLPEPTKKAMVNALDGYLRYQERLNSKNNAAKELPKEDVTGG